MKKLNIVIFGLSITSSWGNGHATTFRSLVKALAQRNHKITFFEKDVPWYAAHRDLPQTPFCETVLYRALSELDDHAATIARADLIIMGSYVADAEQLASRINKFSPSCFAFYDIDTPVTLAKLEQGDYEYLTPNMIPEFDIYLSFTGGPILTILEQKFGAQRARPLYCSVDPELYFPQANPDIYFPTINPTTIANNSQVSSPEYALGYLGTYSDDRQPTVESLLVETATQRSNDRFCVAGAQYPETIQWPKNVEHIEHIPPYQHRRFYNSQAFTLNVTRRDMINAGYSPSVRLFEAGACGTPVISDYWPGLDSFFTFDKEILVARNSKAVIDYLNMPENERRAIGQAMREKVLSSHTSSHRAMELEEYWREVTAPTAVLAAGS